MRQLSVAHKSELFAERAKEAVDILTEMEIPTGSGRIRRIHADVSVGDLNVGGHTWEARAHIVSLPQDKQDGVVENALLIDNADGELTEFFTNTNKRGTVKVSYRFTGDTTQEFLGPFIYETLRADPSEDTGVMTINLQHSKTLREPFPHLRFSTNWFPGMF